MRVLTKRWLLWARAVCACEVPFLRLDFLLTEEGGESGDAATGSQTRGFPLVGRAPVWVLTYVCVCFRRVSVLRPFSKAKVEGQRLPLPHVLFSGCNYPRQLLGHCSANLAFAHWSVAEPTGNDWNHHIGAVKGPVTHHHKCIQDLRPPVAMQKKGTLAADVKGNPLQTKNKGHR